MPVKRRRKRLDVVLAVLLGLASPSLLAQETSELSLYVFDGGLPVAGVEVFVDDELRLVSNVNGLAEVQLEPGIHYIQLRLQDSVVHEQQILAVQDEYAQWIIDVTGGGSAFFDVESTSPMAAGVAAANAAEAEAGPPGLIEGRLVSADDGRPVRGARVFVSGQSGDTRSDAEGRFRIEAPSGTRSVSVLHSGFNTLTRDDVRVPANDTVALEIELTPAGSELPEYVVLVPHISGSLASVLEERRQEVAVANILGAEQISKAGDSDAAQAGMVVVADGTASTPPSLSCVP